MMKETKSREMIKEMFLDALKEDKIPFTNILHKYSNSKPHNHSTKKAYKGNNQLLLMMYLYKNQLKDTRFMTFNQIKADKNLSLEKGSKGIPIEFFSYYDKQEKKQISATEFNKLKKEDKERVSMITRTTSVFHAQNINGLEPFIEKEIDQETLDTVAYKTLHRYLENEDIELIKDHPLVSTPAYSSSKDCIYMPTIQEKYEYLSILAHEIGHSTGHQKRLDRVISNKFGTKEYALEELNAECASAFLSCDLGLVPSKIQETNHKSYVQSWISIIEDQPTALFGAIKEATKIANYVLEKGEYQLIKEQKDFELEQELEEDELCL